MSDSAAGVWSSTPRPLELGDREMIEQALGGAGKAPSEHCFANLYLFRQRHEYRICGDPIPHIRGITYDGKRHALLLAPFDRSVLVGLRSSGIECLYPLDHLPKVADFDGWTAGWSEADSDYWYDGPAMANMAFAKARRAQGKQFARDHAPGFEPWGDLAAAEAETVLEGWRSDVGREADHAECREAIGMALALGLRGGVVRTASGDPVAFLLATRRSDDIHVVHFAKGRRACSGAYPWMFAQYAAATGARLLNFEQDLGNSGLAQSKRAYLPVEIRRKWRLVAPQ